MELAFRAPQGHRRRADHGRDGAYGQGSVARRRSMRSRCSWPPVSSWALPAPTKCVQPRPHSRPAPPIGPQLGPDENSSRFQPNPGLTAADVPRAQGEVGVFHGRRRPAHRHRRLAVHHQSQRQILRARREDRLRALGGRGCLFAHHAHGDPFIDLARAAGRPSSASANAWCARSMRRPARKCGTANRSKVTWPPNITGTPVVSGDQLFVPISSGEEAVAMQPNYSCCTFPRQPRRAGPEDRPETMADLHDHRAAAADPQ